MNNKHLKKLIKTDKKIEKILFYIGNGDMSDEAFNLIENYLDSNSDEWHIRFYYPCNEIINIINSNSELFKSTLCDVVYEGEYDEDEELLNQN